MKRMKKSIIGFSVLIRWKVKKQVFYLGTFILADGDHDLARTVLECIEKNRNSLVMMGTFCFQSLHRSAD
ncbi:hypothetical protein L6164_023567 [Bauhinia variegata]|uniref:Uncharacterized protein n=1 Tax=Bauhinia variegata TaxID=167791 RepID=A0ACB9MJ73_BAUVA|nr:hypothetical protein L6164_023567 [Bauhinia variegata]